MLTRPSMELSCTSVFFCLTCQRRVRLCFSGEFSIASLKAFCPAKNNVSRILFSLIPVQNIDHSSQVGLYSLNVNTDLLGRVSRLPNQYEMISSSPPRKHFRPPQTCRLQVTRVPLAFNFPFYGFEAETGCIFYQIAPLPKICSVCSLSQGATFSSSTSCTNVCLFKSKALGSSLRVCVFYDTMSADGDVCCWSCCPCGFVYTCVLHSAACVCVCAA